VSPRRLLGWAVALLLAWGAFEPLYVGIFTIDRARYAAWLAARPYEKAPGLRQFLAAVRAQTHRGDVIAIAAPFPSWDRGYEYVYARSIYPLAGRDVVPLIDEHDRPRPDNFASATCLAAYGGSPKVSGFRVVWQGAGGTLLRR
jgi:hypothetical protein